MDIRSKLFLVIDDMYCMEDCNKGGTCEDCRRQSIDKILALIIKELPEERKNDWLSCKDEMEWKQKHIDYGYNQYRTELLKKLEVR